jgi:hypothetical protein
MERMPMFEDNTLEQIPQEESVIQKEQPYWKKFTNIFFNEITKTDNPSPEKIENEVKKAFNGVGVETAERFGKTLEKARKLECIQVVEACVDRMALDYADLHDELVEMSLLAEGSQHITPERMAEVRKETKIALETQRGRTLLLMYTNRRKAPDNKTHYGENAALQQALAQVYLSNSNNIDVIGPRLDTFGKKLFEKRFGNEEEYERIKKGVISLAEAHMHLESQGNKVFFPPPKIDAERGIDLFSIEGSVASRFENEINNLFSRNFSIEELNEKNLDPELLKSIRGVQVKTRHHLLEKYVDTYKNHRQEPVSLEQVLEETSLNNIDLGGTNQKVLEGTTFQTSTIAGIGNHRSRAVILSCNSSERNKASYSASYSSDYEAPNNLRGPKKEMAKDFQEAVSFFGQAPKEITKMSYLYIDHTEDIIKTAE